MDGSVLMRADCDGLSAMLNGEVCLRQRTSMLPGAPALLRRGTNPPPLCGLREDEPSRSDDGSDDEADEVFILRRSRRRVVSRDPPPSPPVGVKRPQPVYATRAMDPFSDGERAVRRPKETHSPRHSPRSGAPLPLAPMPMQRSGVSDLTCALSLSSPQRPNAAATPRQCSAADGAHHALPDDCQCAALSAWSPGVAHKVTHKRSPPGRGGRGVARAGASGTRSAGGRVRRARSADGAGEAGWPQLPART